MQVFYILHVLSIVCLFSTCVGAFMAPVPENRKKMLMFSGIASLGAFITGFGIAGMSHIGFPSWLIVKILCWLGLSVLVGLFFRMPEKKQTLLKVSILIVVLALVMVYLKPF